jgi:5-methylcytosine-specific restriction endonuclease McrA
VTRDRMLGENNPLWQGGISFEPYGLKWNEKLREKIRERDNYRCQECFRHQDELYTSNGKKYKLNVHHIDYNKKNNREDNLISLCQACHRQTNFNRNDWTKYYQIKMKGG